MTQYTRKDIRGFIDAARRMDTLSSSKSIFRDVYVDFIADIVNNRKMLKSENLNFAVVIKDIQVISSYRADFGAIILFEGYDILSNKHSFIELTLENIKNIFLDQQYPEEKIEVI